MDLHTLEWKTIPKHLFYIGLDHEKYTIGIKPDHEGIQGYEWQLDIIYRFVHNIIEQEEVVLFQKNNINNSKNKEEGIAFSEDQYNSNHKNWWYKICNLDDDSNNDEDNSEK